MDTFIVFAGSYDTLGAAEADYHAVRDFYLTSGLLDTYDAVVITRDDAGKVRIVVKHEEPARQGAWRGLGFTLDLDGLLDQGHSGLVVVAVSDLGDRIEPVMRRASRLTRKLLKADEKAVAKDTGAAAVSGPDQSQRDAVAESEAAVREAEREARAAERAAEQYSTLSPQPTPRDDLASQLDDLAQLRDEGALTQAEFEAAKSRLLGG